MFDWVLIRKLSELVGYSDDAVRAKIKKGVWREGLHWRKAPDGRIFLSMLAIKQWIEGKA
jgi:hypothetical protein